MAISTTIEFRDCFHFEELSQQLQREAAERWPDAGRMDGYLYERLDHEKPLRRMLAPPYLAATLEEKGFARIALSAAQEWLDHYERHGGDDSIAFSVMLAAQRMRKILNADIGATVPVTVAQARPRVFRDTHTQH